jgi:hypothetical protein
MTHANGYLEAAVVDERFHSYRIGPVGTGIHADPFYTETEKAARNTTC